MHGTRRLLERQGAEKLQLVGDLCLKHAMRLRHSASLRGIHGRKRLRIAYLRLKEGRKLSHIA